MSLAAGRSVSPDAALPALLAARRCSWSQPKTARSLHVKRKEGGHFDTCPPHRPPNIWRRVGVKRLTCPGMPDHGALPEEPNAKPPGGRARPRIHALFLPGRPHSPWGSTTPASPGESSSQSASSAVPSRLVLNCFPPFTFQVPTATWIRLKCVNSDWRSAMARRTLGVTERRQRRARLSASAPRASPPTPPKHGWGLCQHREGRRRAPGPADSGRGTGTHPCGVFATEA